jgi:hypothetical protein
MWSETIECDSSDTLISCCRRRAKGWGIFSPWTLINAVYNECSNRCSWYIQRTPVSAVAAGGDYNAAAANLAGGHYNLVSSCYGEVIEGFEGPKDRPWSMDPAMPINKDVLGYIRCVQSRNNRVKLQWGPAGVIGKGCADATDNDILACLKASPPAGGGWTVTHNCQTHVNKVSMGCCLICFQFV